MIVLCALITCTTAADTIYANQTIRNGETIISAKKDFELGFFNPKNSANWYVGIWYKRISPGTVMWVANRNTPLANNSGELSLTPQGILVVWNTTGGVVWSSANSTESVRRPVAQLLDNGNFIVREETDDNPENRIWQSFDFPTDTFVPGMKFGKDLITGLERHFTSWKSENNPSLGEHTVWIDTKGYPQLVARNREKIVFRTGPWNGVRFSGEPNSRPNSIYRFGFVLDQREMYYHYDIINSSVVARLVMKPSGSLEQLLWMENWQEWMLYSAPQTDNCDRYGLCGPFASCNINNSPACECLRRFEPTSPEKWNVADWSQGCRRSTPLDCGSGDGFRKYSSLKLPDTQESWFNQSMDLQECEMVCKKNCSCTAYTTQNITGTGSGCLLWFGNLIDIRTFTENGQDLYIRMPALELGTLEEDYGNDPGNKNSKDDLELPLIDFSSLRKATNNFSVNNKLGQGGFGPVYKGVLGNGQEVAVKRLSRTSTQGLNEFKNEVIFISKLQHRNLVKLLGCCIKGAEKILVYEYMQNKSLDSFIFDGAQSKILDWPTRFHIIKGIARGLVYLHQDSRLRIIHRDLKVSNILLDHDMIPKISDFGLARSFGGNQIEANTNRVVGTYGYMAPEYAVEGIFSTKSDVFSFGVLVLEIVSGKKNRGFVHKEHSHNLLGHAWGLHNEGRSLELVAASLDESICPSEVIRSIHVGLLCVQPRPEDRPTMYSVILMFESDCYLPPPKFPAADTIHANQTIRNGETIISAQKNFELGFFNPKNSTNWYVGIWYKKISPGTVMWVANRNTPLANNSGELSLTPPRGILVVRNATGGVIWASANSTESVRRPVAQLLDNGNFIVREETDDNPENRIWQSFDFPTDTFVPGMKFGKDLVTGLERHFTSWKSENDPSLGEHTVWIDTKGYPQLVARNHGKIVFRAGPWNGVRFSGQPNLRPNSIYRFGRAVRLLWIENRQEWLLYLTPQTDNCDRYGICGPFASCNINNSPDCGCFRGFEPTSPDQRNVADWSQGCRRSTPLDCGPGDGFRKYSSLKLPDTQESWFNQSMDLYECEMICKNNCNCSAYTTQNISGTGSGCLLWFGNLIDIRTFTENGQDLYIRMPASELAKGKSWSVKKRVVIIVLTVSVLLVILLSAGVLYRRKRRKVDQEGTLEEDYGNDPDNRKSKDDLELPLIDFSTLRKATNNFSVNNKLGQGGFGPVYKGVLGNGQEVAVKRLSRTSSQGLNEFKNEVIFISKLQHRNLVKLLGCCIMGAEKILVYEYMQNKSLDSFIFDGAQSKTLDWPTRFHIIKGIARGLVYLHQDSRLRIIHRDLKVSNILLDHDMIPKISDFGLARSFGGNQIEANTNRVVGTYGYMAPEYAVEGIFSTKSDVFSFGVLVLEVVSGKKNRGFVHKEHSHDLLGHAWELHNEGRSWELVAASLDESICSSEVIRSIHVGLLCVQPRPEDRPTMYSVILMFESDCELPPPKLPDTIYANQTIRNGETIISANQNFELGFFNPKNSTNWYIGIWFKRLSPGTQTVIWVANRNSPLSVNSGELTLTLHGILVVRNTTGNIVWLSANSSLPSVKKPVGRLLDTGNFIVREENSRPENPIWQSFDFPTDTFVAGMKLGKDLVTGVERYLTSWKSENDPSVGDYTLWIDTKGYPQMIIRDAYAIRFRAGPWNGLRFSGLPEMRQNPGYSFGFVLDHREMYYHFDDINSSEVSRLVIQPTGDLETMLWKESMQEWSLYSTLQTDACDRYGICGSFTSCNISYVRPCGCLEGFEPTSTDQRNVTLGSQGCGRSTPLNCGPEESFRKYSSLKLPDTQESWFNQSMDLHECEMVCKKNCNCSAYTTQNITGTGSGCLLWFGDLIDIRTFTENGQDLYIRMPASEFGDTSIAAKGKSSGVKKRVVIIAPIISVLLVILLFVGVFYLIKWKAKQEGTLEGDYGDDPGKENMKNNVELPLIDLSTLRKATDNFSKKNKLGEGGFGPVYKGVLRNGQEVAVKRLSRTSNQGLDEFKNEVIFISKLQHRNLVKLLGCCIKGAEKMLVYEYMPNKSLDSFIFDGAQSKILDWPTRFHIIKGIARGLVYLHQDSRLRIIHRDLKVSNILLDHDMIPKISDFGLARSFGGNQIQANTNRVVGT
ncbi:hypothetical protein OSB04_015677 [Centaurea solstitialis]|uniref:non-specific serine/threonine protein kinase n=1 Tax=Centaurea solstitialis TaxID=347529 RepID=A0AA38W7Q5_9ASTR|nr:hypothetical protein OSB04_015677 [Centaurea solstitialis]